MAKNTANTEGAATALPPQFESFNKLNAVGLRGAQETRPILGSSATGNWRLNKHLVELLKLKPGAGIAFHYDGAQEQWYVERDDKEGFVLREDKDDSLQFNSTVLLSKMQKSFPDEVTHGRTVVTTEPTRIAHRLLYAVLTGSTAVTRKPRN